MTTQALATDPAKADAMLTVMVAAGSAAPGDRVSYLEQLEGGWSRHSYAATVEHAEGDRRDYIIRVRPRASTLDTDLEAEFRTYALLATEPVPTPGVHGFESSDDTPFDGPFFVMDRMHGSAPNVWRPADRQQLADDWEGGRQLATDLVTHMASIHAIGAERAAAAAVSRNFRQTVDHWQDVYEEMRLVRDPVIDETYAWVRDREPEPVEACLVHGDYRIGNCLIDGGRVTAILDWELAFVGDPRFDLGYMSLEYHAGKFTTPGSPLLNAVADRKWLYERYTQLSGRPVDVEVVNTFTALGALMLFAIMTTGLRVFASGQTTDIKMAWTRFALPGIRQDLSRLMGWPAR
jgi:aminoglycoside phosphotransferase (APT) family kinase protein